MYKDITVKYSSEFARYTDAVLVTGDVNAYRIVFETPWELDGCNFKVTAKRADGKVVTDLGITEGTKAICVLANSMYSVVGDLIFHLTLVDNAGTVLTACEVVAYVVEGNGDSVPAENLTPILDNVLKSVAEIKEREAELESALKIHQTAAELDHPDGSVTNAKIADKAINEAKLADGSVTNAKIADGSVTSDKIEPGSVNWRHIDNNSILTDKIYDKAVATDKIADGAVTSDKLANKSVNGDKLAAEVTAKSTDTAFKSIKAVTQEDREHDITVTGKGIIFNDEVENEPVAEISLEKGIYIPQNSNGFTDDMQKITLNGSAPGKVTDGSVLTKDKLEIAKNVTKTVNVTAEKMSYVDSTEQANVHFSNLSPNEVSVSAEKFNPDTNASASTRTIVSDENISITETTSDGDDKAAKLSCETFTLTDETATPSKATQDKLNITVKEVSLEHKEYNGAGDLTSNVIHKLTGKANKTDLTAKNIISVYSSKITPHKLVNKPGIPNMTGNGFAVDIARVTDIGGTYVPTYTIDYVWEQQHRNTTSTTYFVNYDTGSSSATGLFPGEALKYPSDAMTKAKSGDMIVIMGGYYPRNQLGFDQNKSVHIQGGIFCNADNNRSLTWTLVKGSTYKTTRSQAYAVWQAIKDGSEFSELLPTPTLARCKSTNGSYFIDGDTVYVNTPDGYSGAPGYDILVSLNAVGATINTNVWCENTVFVFGGQAACLNRSSTDPALFSDCTFKYAKQNGFMSQGGKSYLLNCESYNNGRDGFSYKKLNSNVSYGFEVGCTAHHNGDDESTGSDNGSTAHEGSIVTRINGKYYENKGPNIADVNPGTMSYNLNCACSNSTATAQDRRIDYNIEDGIMYLDRCTSDGSFISLYEASVTMPQTTKSYNLGSVLPGVYRVKNVNGVAENLSGGEDIANKVTSISSSSTHVQYPSAKSVNDVVSAQKTDIAQNYANALKGKVTGNNAVRIDDSSPIEHEMNVRVSSKNVIPYPYAQTTKTEKGITFTDNGDGTITVNGTATGDTAMTLVNSPTSLSEGSYVLSGTPNGGVTTYYIQAYIDGKYGRADVAGQTAIYSVNKGQKVTRIEFYVKTGATFDNLVVKPQFERGTTATDYTPYVDVSTVALTQRGKNLIPYKRRNLSNYGVNFTVNDDGSLTANGTATAPLSQYFHATGTLYNVPNGKVYTLSDPTSDSETTYQTRGQTLTPDGSGGFTFLCTKAKPYYTWSNEQAATVRAGVFIKTQVSPGTTISNLKFYPQFELGNAATKYEPPLPEITYSVPEDGIVTGIKNIYPTTTLLANKDNVVIDVEYNRDINKAFEELQNAILAQGSNT